MIQHSFPTRRSSDLEHQPFTPFVETIRSLLLGTPMGSYGMLAVAWALILAAIGFVWSMTLYERKSLG